MIGWQMEEGIRKLDSGWHVRERESSQNYEPKNHAVCDMNAFKNGRKLCTIVDGEEGSTGHCPIFTVVGL